MILTRAWLRSIVPLALTLAAGCAPAYHSYSGCCVECKYCVPQPLPYWHYEGCACHSCAASKYMALPPKAVEKEGISSDTDGEDAPTE